jgi:hypothetical protein
VYWGEQMAGGGETPILTRNRRQDQARLWARWWVLL